MQEESDTNFMIRNMISLTKIGIKKLFSQIDRRHNISFLVADKINNVLSINFFAKSQPLKVYLFLSAQILELDSLRWFKGLLMFYLQI